MLPNALIINIMNIMIISNITHFMNIMNIMNNMSITAWMAMAGAVLALVLALEEV